MLLYSDFVNLKKNILNIGINEIIKKTDTSNSKDLILLKKSKHIFAYLLDVKTDENKKLSELGKEEIQTLIYVSLKIFLKSIAGIINSRKRLPLVIFIDDCQWIDNASLKIFAKLLNSFDLNKKLNQDSNLNILFVLTYRPEFKPLKEFRTKSSFHEQELFPLEIKESGRLIKILLKNENIPKDLINLIHERSTGNPFYIEEVLNYMADQQEIEYVCPKWILKKETDSISIPYSITNIILSRIDSLEKTEKDLLNYASIIGFHFHKRFLNSILNKIKKNKEIQLDYYLNHLKEEEWIKFSSQNNEIFQFKNSIISEVCYKSILNYNKKIIHKFIYEEAEKSNINYGKNYAFLAYHLEKTEPLKDTADYRKMIDYLIKTATAYQQNFQNNDAIQIYDRIIAKYEIDLKTLTEVLIKKSASLSDSGFSEKALALAEKALINSKELADTELIADSHSQLGDLYILKHSYDQAVENFELVLKNTTSSEKKAKTYNNFGLIAYYQGKFKEAEKYYLKTAILAKEIKSKEIFGKCLNNLANIYTYLGEYLKAEKYLEDLMEIGKETENLLIEASANLNLGNVNYLLKKPDIAIKHFTTALNIFENITNLCFLQDKNPQNCKENSPPLTGEFFKS